jgi:hypothetical protein
LDLTLINPRQIEDPAPSETEPERGLPARKPPRRIVVRPEQVFQREFYRRTRLSLESVVIHYVLISAAIVAGLSILAALGLALLRA